MEERSTLFWSSAAATHPSPIPGIPGILNGPIGISSADVPLFWIISERPEKSDNETKEQIRAEKTAMDLFLFIGWERGRNLNDQSDDLSGQKDREYGIKDLLP